MVIIQKTADIQQHFMRNDVSDVANDWVIEWLLAPYAQNPYTTTICPTNIKYTWMLSDIVDALPKGVKAGSFEKSHADEISQCLENHGDIELTYSMTFEPPIGCGW